MFKNGVFERFILISFPRPDAAFSDSERIKLPYSFFPSEYLVFASAPLIFLLLKFQILIPKNQKLLLFQLIMVVEKLQSRKLKVNFF